MLLADLKILVDGLITQYGDTCPVVAGVGTLNVRTPEAVDPFFTLFSLDELDQTDEV